MACHVFGAKSLPQPMQVYYQLDLKKKTLVKFESKYKTFHSWKCIENIVYEMAAILFRWVNMETMKAIAPYSRPLGSWLTKGEPLQDNKGLLAAHRVRYTSAETIENCPLTLAASNVINFQRTLHFSTDKT